VADDTGDPFVTFLLYLLRGVPVEHRREWMVERLPKTSVLLGLHAAEWDVATRQVAM
jgi:hypothetical protein